MSLQWKIEQKIKDICIKNNIPVSSIKVTSKRIAEELRRKYVIIFEIEIVFETNKTLLDYFIIIHNSFIIKFKTYRVYIDFPNKSLNFTMKERNLSVIKDILGD